jgi:hypothetical protein
MPTNTFFSLVALTLAALSVPAAGQLIVSVAVPPDNNATLLASGSTITFPPTALNASIQATVTFTNSGAQRSSVNGITFAGANTKDFGLVNAPLFPLVLQTGDVHAIGLRFSPGQSTSSSATMDISLDTGDLVLSLVGRVANPQYSLSYIDPSTNNSYSLVDGAKISMPTTPIGATQDLGLVARNTGLGPGTVDAVSLSGSSYQLVNTPLLPAVVEAGGSMSFGIRFSPTSNTPSPSSANLQVTLGGTLYRIEVDALVSIPPPPPTASLTYELSSSSGPTPVDPGTAIALPDVALGSQSQISVVVRNVGTGSAVLNTITVSGGSFSFDDVPPIPLTLAAGDSQTLTIDFRPTSPDKQTGRLMIGNASFPLSATGLGPRLSLSYLAGTTPVTVPENGTIAFDPLAAGTSAQLSITVTNTGTTNASINVIVPVSQSGSYTVPALPLPATLAPQQSINFPVVFAPTTVGEISASLLVNSSSWNLVGFATRPPDLSGVSINTDNVTAQPLTQPLVSLSLSTAYPLSLHGTLTVALAASQYGADPAVQWITGGQTVPFSVPAGSTQAMFPGGGSQVGLQVGTLAGTIAVTSSFSLDSGFSLTPVSPPTLQLTVPASPPQLLAFQLQAPTASGVSLNIVGYSTTKQLNKLTFQFTPVSGAQLAVNHAELDVSATALVYYRNPATQAFGGLFSITVPVALSTDQTNTANLLAKIQSITVVASNDLGDSGPMTVSPQTH